MKMSNQFYSYVKILFLLIALTVGFGGQQDHGDERSETTRQSTQQIAVVRQSEAIVGQEINRSMETPEEISADEFADVKNRPKWMDSCLPALYPDTWLDTILAHPNSVLKLHDNCVISMIDSLGALIKSDTCFKCLEALNAVANVSDGYVSEIIDGEAGELYYHATDLFIRFLANPQYKSDRLLGNLVHSFYYEMMEDITPEHRRAEIIIGIYLKRIDRGCTEEQRRLLIKLEQKVKELRTD